MAKKTSASETRAVLHFEGPGAPGQPIKLRQEATILGREKGDIPLGDPEVSSLHCQIQCVKGVYNIFDMNSTNGTFVNGVKVVRSELKNGDKIQVGKTFIEFKLDEASNVQHISTLYSTRKAQSVRATVVDSMIERQLDGQKKFEVKIEIEQPDGRVIKAREKQSQFYIGRASSLARFDTDPEISRKHLQIKVNSEGEVFIQDLGSTNGSYLNDKAFTGMVQASPTDVIRIGSFRLKFAAHH